MSIIAISGKKTVGKDTVGKIICYLTAQQKLHKDWKHIKNIEFDHSILQFINNETPKDFLYNEVFNIKKFADKLKDIICLLINCTRDQLEDESFKSKELGEEWWYWYMERVGGYSPIILDYLTTTKKELKSYEGLELVKPTPRFLLQFIGTNLFRDQLHPEIWVNSLMNEYKDYYFNIVSKEDVNRGVIPTVNVVKKELNWIITDTRFENELEAVKKRGGITIRVNRPCNICGGSGYHKMSCPVSKSGEHYSEIALDSAAFDFVINNNKDIEHLVKEVKKILKKLNII